MKATHFFKIEKLREYYVDSKDSQQYLDDVLNLDTYIQAFKAIQDNFAIKKLVQDAERVIKGIDFTLQHQEILSESERKCLLRDKKIHLYYITRLSGNKLRETMEAREKKLDEEFALLFPNVDNNP